MIPRVLEPEVMDIPEEAADYDSMDHSRVNRAFVDDLLDSLAVASPATRLLDVGTGTARILVELRRSGFAGPITGIDLAREMLSLGRQNIVDAQLTGIELEQVDAKLLPYADGFYDVVISNSIVHHIPQPERVFREMRRVLQAGGLLFVRDLLRPPSAADVEELVARHAGGESVAQQQLFRQSLHAALTLEEVAALLQSVGINDGQLVQTSDRHWTLSWRCPTSL